MFPKITGTKRQVMISGCLYLGQLISGYSIAWPGPILPKLRDLEQSPLPYLLTESQLAFVATFIFLGTIPGPYLMLWLSNVKGRKPCLISSGLIIALAYIVLALAKTFATLAIGRFFIGIGCGSITIMNLVYIGEIASTNIRGVLLTVIGVSITVGSILLFSTAPYVSYHGTLYIGLSLCIVYTICLLFIPESPNFYIIQGKDKELKEVLQYLDRLDEMDELLETRKEIMETNTKRDWMELFTIKYNRKALFVVVVINMLQHSSGIMAVVLFSASIFDLAGSSIKSSIAMIIICCFQVLGSCVTPFFIESTGRKKILIMSSALCSLSMLILGLYFYLDHIGNPIISHIKWLPLVLLILFYIGYESGLGIIPNAIIGEMFTSNVRSKGSTLAMTISWVFGFIVTTAFGALLEIVGGHVAFWFFSCTCGCAVLFTIFFVPETKGKTLLEIQKSL